MSRIGVVIAEPDESRRHLLASAFDDGADVALEFAHSHAQLVAALKHESADCLIFDSDQKDSARVMADAVVALAGRPLIVVSARRDQQVVIDALRCGAADFVPLPDNPHDGFLLRHVRHAVADWRVRRANRRRAQSCLRKLLDQAQTDELTGLHNRRHLLQALGSPNCGRKPGRKLGCIMLDVDHFKAINDRHGHTAGDLVLKHLAGILRESLAPADTAVRWGGEEFLILRPSATLTDCWLWAEQLRQRLVSGPVQFGPEILPFTVSAGISTASTCHLTERLIREADEALYLAKRSGRNEVCTRDMVWISKTLADSSSHAGSSIEDRREQFLRRSAPALGAEQTEHVVAHCQRVATLAADLAEIMGLEPARVRLASQAGLLHDIGKCAVPEELLAKPAGLTTGEYGLLDRMIDQSRKLSQSLGADDELLTVLRHARPSAEPRQTPQHPESRILLVADAFDSLTHARPYRPAQSPGKALAEMNRMRGAQFGGQVLDALRLVIAGNRLAAVADPRKTVPTERRSHDTAQIAPHVLRTPPVATVAL